MNFRNIFCFTHPALERLHVRHRQRRLWWNSIGVGDEDEQLGGAVGMGQRRHVQGPAHSNHGERSGVRMLLYCISSAPAICRGEFESTRRGDIASCRACHSYFPVLPPVLPHPWLVIPGPCLWPCSLSLPPPSRLPYPTLVSLLVEVLIR